ncbi:hypothetical protein MAP00_007657 [Monascus purpureus]|nr:hypothetical protein MAP00_007657 [Monascus purpureus]
MGDSFTLPLRPLSETHHQKDTLPVAIAQINAQWGSFRDVSEASLRAELEAEKDKDALTETEDSKVNPPADIDTAERLEQLYKRRAEITQFAIQAHMETMFALDFVSLILSKHAPRQAEMSISPFLKQMIPLGSLSAEVVNPPPKSEAAKIDINTVSRGWRLQSFNAAADKLLKSAARLEQEVESETRYWGEVLTVKDKGWKVCRLPGERQALGVQYGFLEATPIFRDRGLASLRRADDGSLLLDKGLVPSKNRAVRVRIKENGQITGCSKLHKSAVSSNMGSVEGHILQARDNIFEEELFHELVREARVMAGQGVTTRQNLVQFPVSGEQEILLDLVDADSGEDGPVPSSQQNSMLAEGLSHFIHILLSYSHRQNLYRRMQIPAPLTSKRKRVPEYHLLRPSMAYLQHNFHLQFLQSFMKDIHATVKSSGLLCGYTSTPFSSVELPGDDISRPRAEALVGQFLRPLESVFSSDLVTPGSSLKVHIRTNLSGPPLGTNYDFSIRLSKFPDVQPPSRVGLKDDAAAVITHLMLLDIVSAISSYRPNKTNSNVISTQNTNEAAKNPLTWEATYPHHGELLAFSPAMGVNKKMKVILTRDKLTLQTHYVRGAGSLGQRGAEKNMQEMRSCTWTASPEAKDPMTLQQSLMEFLAEASKD